MAEGTITKHEWPGGITTVASTTKPIPKSFARPWQKPMAPFPEKCALEKPQERETAHLTHTDPDSEKWYVIDSFQAPETPHRLIVPDLCWPEEKMQTLGGEEKIKTALTLAQRQFAKDRELARVMCFSIQVGMYAAQNQRHTHYHLYAPNFEGAYRPLPVNIFKIREHLVDDDGVFSVWAGGLRAGQCIIVPNEPAGWMNSGMPMHLAHTLSKLILRMSTKFKTPEPESLPPNYRFEFEIVNGTISHGSFVPILNQLGTLEDAVLFDHMRGWNLPWSHKETADYLRAE